jgi:hypothetical protein
LVLGILHGVQGKFPEDVSGAAVGPIFNGRKLKRKLITIEEGTHNGSRNVVGKFTLHTVQNPQNQKSVFIPR